MSPIPEFRNLIGGELRRPSSGRYLDSINPVTGQVWARVPASDRSDADAAVSAAAAALPAWAALTWTERGAYLDKVAAIHLKHGEELARLETTDNGNPLAINTLFNTDAMAALWGYCAKQTLPGVSGMNVVLNHTMHGYTRREPYGVVVGIIAFNMPVGMFGGKAAAALAGGNTVVIKPPEQASCGVLRLGEILADVLPPGVVNIVSGLGEEVADALVRHPKVAKVSMTGSSGTARLIQRAAADTLTPCVFELGGKSPNIVLADADLDKATPGLTYASMYNFNAGQSCVAGSRILVERPILDEVVERIHAAAKKVVIGDPFDPATTMGPIISREQYNKVVGYIVGGAKEAELLFGGRHGAQVCPALPNGYWIEPTLFMAKDNGPLICREEIFGPVAVVIPFDTDDEAITIANDTHYGLASAVWTKDLSRANRYVRDIEAGNVWVNTYAHSRFDVPFGGFKDSGYGHDSVSEFTREKTAIVAF
jgi:aldehyde dehydrogenase (NAD+)